MAQKSLILLFGGRPQPNAVLAAMEKPSRIIAVVSRDSRYNAKEVLENLVTGTVIEKRVPPYRIDQIQRVLESVLDEKVQAIGVTGAPVPMAVVAYELGRQRGIPVYYVNSSHGEIIDLVHADQKPMRIRLAIPEFLKIYRLHIADQPGPRFATSPTKRYQVARLLGQHSLITGHVLAWLRRNTSAQEGSASDLLLRKKWPTDFQDEHWGLLQQLQHFGILTISLSKRRMKPGPRSPVDIRFPAEGERKFVFGEWLEMYIEDVARETNLLDDIQRGIYFKVEDGYRELDFLGLHRGIALLGSCKATRRPWRKSYLDELNAVADLMGGRYTWRFFFTDQVSPSQSDHNAYRSFDEFMAHARRHRIRVITARDLPNWGQILSHELKSPTYPLI